MEFKKEMKDGIEVLTHDIAYYTSHPEGVKLILAISTFITIFTALTFIPTVRWIIVIIFGLTALGFGYRLYKIKR